MAPTSGAVVKPNERWSCLKTAPCNDKASACSGKGRLVHRTKLTNGAKLIPSTDTYVVECVATPQGEICTTGNADTDNVVFQSTTNLSQLASTMKYQFEYFTLADGLTPATNPVKSTQTGDLGPYEWQSKSKITTRKFLAVNYVSPDYQSGQSTSQQQATFGLDLSSSNCVSVRYDPYGIIFDSQTLEPVPDAKITLYEKVTTNGTAQYVMAGNTTNTQGITPNQTTEEDGLYNFVVPPGTYKLIAAKGGYNFPVTLDRVNQYYAKAYSGLYPEGVSAPAGTAGGDGRNYDIDESFSIVHRDIPMDPVPATANHHYPVKLMDYYYQLKDKYSTILSVEGRASHPFTKIKVYSIAANADPKTATPLRLLQTIQSTKTGNFQFEIDQSQLQPGEKFGKVVLEKVDFSSGLSWVNKVSQTVASAIDRLLGFRVNAQQTDETGTSSVGFDPILNYVEGMAYDAAGNPLPNATVGVYLKFSEKPYAEVKTDDIGYFHISSERLPFMPYELRYVSATGSRSEVTTSQFIKQNADTIRAKKIDLYSFRNDKGELVTPSPKSDDTNSSGKETLNPSPGAGQNQSVSPSNMMLVVVVVVFIVIVGVAVALYLMKKSDKARQI